MLAALALACGGATMDADWAQSGLDAASTGEGCIADAEAKAAACAESPPGPDAAPATAELERCRQEFAAASDAFWQHPAATDDLGDEGQKQMFVLSERLRDAESSLDELEGTLAEACKPAEPEPEAKPTASRPVADTPARSGSGRGPNVAASPSTDPVVARVVRRHRSAAGCLSNASKRIILPSTTAGTHSFVVQGS